MAQKSLDAAQAFYYGLWANLREIPLPYRAFLVIFAAVCLAWLIARPVFLKLLSWLTRLLAAGVKGLCLLGELLFSPLSKGAPERYLRMCNGWNGAMGKCHGWLMRRAEGISRVEPHIGRAAVVYLVLAGLVALPFGAKYFVSGQYIPYLSFAARIYQRLEAPALEAAAAYEPLLMLDFGESGRPGQEALESEPGESAPEEIWLSLSSAGRRGTNIRSGPGKSHRVLAVISGDEQVLYLGEQEDGWIHISRADGTEGWIFHNLLTPVPQEEDGGGETP